MNIFLRYGIPPLLPLFFSLCAGVTAGNYLSVSLRPLLSSAPVLLTLSIILIVFVQEKESNSSCSKTASLLKLLMIKSRSDLSVCLPLLFITLFFTSGYHLTQSALYPHLPENHISHFTDREVLEITGKISSQPEEFFYNRSEQSYKRLRFTLSILNIIETEKDVNLKKTGDIQMSVYTPLVQYKQGDIIKFKGKIKSLRNFNNPGGFDYIRYMKIKGICGRVNVNGNSVTLLYDFKKYDLSQSEQGLLSINSMIMEKLNHFREEFATHIFRHIGDSDSGAILCALTTGNTEFISEELIRDFSETGVSHILSVSGLHLSIVGILFFYLFKLLLSSSEWFLIRGWSRKGAALLTIFPIIIYSLLSGNSDATQRSMIMIIIFMTAAIVERESDMFNSLAAAGIAVLLVDPLSLFEISFQLSFSAVFFILMGLSSVDQYRTYLPEIRIGVLRKIAGFMFISLCATAGTQILVMRYFNLFSFSGVLANLVIIPGVGFGTLYLGFAALFLYPFSIQSSGLMIKCAAIILKPSIGFIRNISALPWSYAETFTPDIVEIACYYLFISAIFFAAKFWKNKRAYLLVRCGIMVAVLSCLIIIIYELFWIKERFFNTELKVTVLDVGQGNSALIEMPQGETILVDGGGFSYGDKFDTGKNIVAPFLRQKKIMTLDAVVLTHPDSDHINGLVYIFDHFKVNLLIKNCDQPDSDGYRSFISSVKRAGTRVYIVDHRAENIKIGRGELHLFHPLKPCSDKNTKDLNSNSVVFKVVFNKASLLFPGDIMADTEREIAYKNGQSLKSDILIAPHHGSAGSSSDIFLDRVAPESIIISCGWQNRFGFPRTIVLKRCRKRGIEILRTDLNGAVTLCSDGKQWDITAMLR